MRRITKEQAVALDAASTWLRNKEEFEAGQRVGLFRGFWFGIGLALFVWLIWSVW